MLLRENLRRGRRVAETDWATSGTIRQERDMGREEENTPFTCENCDREVLPLSNGSYRNHCPFCLFSKHVDVTLGDRRNECGGLMSPTGLTHKGGKGLQIIHRCRRCRAQSANRVAEDSVQPDDAEELLQLPPA